METEGRSAQTTRAEGNSVPKTASLAARKAGLQEAEDHRSRGIWGSDAGPEGRHRSCVCDEGAQEDGHGGEGTGEGHCR